MKKIILVLLLSLTVLFPVLAGDYGITIDTNYEMLFDTNSEIDWDKKEYTVKSSLWANSKMGEDIALELEGSYTFTNSRVFFVEFDKLKLSGEFEAKDGNSGAVSLSLGRMNFSEFSGKVFSHSGDGFNLTYALPHMSVNVYSFFTGLLQAPSSSINLNLTDVTEQNPQEIPFLGPAATPRMIEGISITFPEILAHQTIILSGVFQQDLRPEDDFEINQDSPINTIHAGLCLTGSIPVINSFFYALYGYGNTGWYNGNTIAAFMAGGSINYFIPQFAASKITFEGLYSSGDADHKELFREGNTSGYDTAFLPLTPSPAGYVFTDQQTNLFYGSLLYSLKPFASSKSLTLQNILGMVKGTVFFRSTTGMLSSSQVKLGETGNYLGTEVDLSLFARLLSDVGFSLKGGIFIPSSIMEVLIPQIKATAALSLTI